VFDLTLVEEISAQEKQTMKVNLFRMALPAMVAVGLSGFITPLHASFIQLGRTNYFQNFDTLNTAGKSKFLPPGWSIASQDGQIYADNGNMSQANIYSYGLPGSSDRALGALTSGGNAPIFGASFQNAGPGPINQLHISYLGEEWRLGVQGRANTLQFSYSLNASGVNDMNATWINVPSLSFTTPNLTGVGAHDGTQAANQRQIASSISFLNIPQGGTFWIRWQEPKLSGQSPGDGLAVDNFSLTAVPEASTWGAALAAAGLLGIVLWKRNSIGSRGCVSEHNAQANC